MSKLVLYYHAGAGNHGCEAIVRATKKILKKNLTLYSECIEEDNKYRLNELVDICEDKGKKIYSNQIDYYRAAVAHKIRKDDYVYISLSHKSFFNQVEKGDIYISIGGDNYCYSGKDILGYYNKRIHQKGAKTVLWGCSVDPKDINQTVAKDLARYDLIVARESISYEGLIKVNNNTILYPDPAFLLDTEERSLPDSFVEGHTIGINVSPLVIDSVEDNIVMDNYSELLKWIIENTEEQIALIPHVVKPEKGDMVPLKQLFDKYKETGRVCIIDDCNCMQLKWIISKCRFFVGARTHATIAAYSSFVPTIVIGYSVKSYGIARDLFDTHEHYVIPVQNLNDTRDLINEFLWLIDNEEMIKGKLERYIPEYKDKLWELPALIDTML